ncbi:MAG: class II aldolase/adducin family protein [Bacteroidales bacterium]
MQSLPSEFLAFAREITEYSHLAWQKGFTEANGGNISIRLPDNLIMSTPTLESKRDLQDEDMVISNFHGKKIFGKRDASSEITSHIAIYKANPEALSVIHTHPPFTCSFACTNNLPLSNITPESVLWTGKIAIIPYHLPGSEELSDMILNLSVGSKVLLLRNHGLITWGESLKEAWWRTEVMENTCRISHYISVRGDSATLLTEDEVAMIEKKYLSNSKLK